MRLHNLTSEERQKFLVHMVLDISIVALVIALGANVYLILSLIERGL